MNASKLNLIASGPRITALAIVVSTAIACFIIKLPFAAPTILALVNKSMMLFLPMVVISLMISLKGLGNEVLQSMGRLDAGKAIVGGLGIANLAVIPNLISQGTGQSGCEHGHRHRSQGGPIRMNVHTIHK